MGITTLAGDGGSQHPVAAVFFHGKVFGGNGRGEAGPASSGVKLGIGNKKSSIAANTAIEASVVKVPILAGTGPLRAGMPRDFIGFRSKLLPPFFFRLNDLGDTLRRKPVSSIGKLRDLD